MSKKLEGLSQINKELNGALSLLQERLGDLPIQESTHGNIVQGTASLLQRCADIVGEEKKAKPVIRVIHHLACSGGSLISKCISSMPNVYLLSETHPTAFGKHERDNISFSPTNIPLQCHYANIPDLNSLNSELFKSSIRLVHSHCENIGGYLVLREHSHSDFTSENDVPTESPLLSLLKDDYDIRSLVTVREPTEAYSSLKRNGWIRFEPPSFDEYCRRLNLFLSQFNKTQIFKYENFIDCPKETMESMCEHLRLGFNESFEYIFDYFKVSGDSGRKGSVIEKRPREIVQEVIESKDSSSNYKSFLKEYYSN